MHTSLIVMVGLSLGMCRLACAEERPSRVISAPDKEQQLKEAQQLYEEGEKLWKEGKYEEVKNPVKHALRIRELLLGQEHVKVAACLHLLGMAYEQLAMYAEAEAMYQRALRIKEAALGPNHPVVATTLNNLANTYEEQGHHERAESLHLRTLRINEAALGPNHPNVARTLNNLANIYKDQGQYDRAEPLHQRALRILEAVLGPNHQAVASSLNNLANVYMNSGQYDRAEPLHQRALRIREAALGPDHPDVARSLENLATLYSYLGQYDRAEALYQRALRIREAALGPKHPDLAVALTNLASDYADLGQYDRAEPLYQRALRIREAVLGPNNYDVGNTLNNLAKLYSALGQYDRAELMFQRALRINEVAMGPNHPDVASSLNNLAELYVALGQYDRAEPVAQRALRIRQAALGVNHRDTADSLHNMALLTLLQRKLPQALQYGRIAFDRDEQQLRSQGLILSAGGFASLLASLHSREETHYSMLLQNLDCQPLARLALSEALLRKSRTADEAAQFFRAVYLGFSQPDRQLFDSLRVIRSRFASLSLAGPGKMDLARYHSQLAGLDSQANAIEEDLARRSAPLRARRNLPGTSNVVEQVAAQLPRDSVLVELVAFHRQDFQLPKVKQPNELRYMAFILTPNRRVTAVDLGLAKPIDDAVDSLYAALSNPSAQYEAAARELFNKLMKPFLSALGSSRRLILSVDGQLQLIPFDVLHDGKTLLGDRFQISYVSSGRDLLARELGREPATNLVVFADPDFGARISSPSNEAIALGTSRGQRGLRPAYLDPLPGTRKEAEALKQMVPSAQLLLGKEATEQTLLGLATPGILHIATHGLFADDPTSLNRSRSAHSHFEEDAAPLPNHPLLRSALALAGALSYQAPADAQAPDRPDGLVTALEMAGLNLWGTQLVVLSACNTGRGSVQLGQGVNGLRRAVISAGAETLVTSLWKVNDEATQELMTGYYQRLRRGEGRAEAMQKAAREMRQKRSHPYYWASFVVIGRSEPLRGI